MLALAFYQGWWGVRPKSPVTSQPPSFGRSPVSGRSSYTLFHGGLPTALLTIPLRDAVWPLTFMLAHKAVPHACRHLLFTYMCSPRYQLAQTPVSPHGAAGQQKQTPRLSMCICKTAVFTAPLFQKYTAVWGPPEICRRCCLISVKYRKIDFWSVRCIFGTAPYGKWQW